MPYNPVLAIVIPVYNEEASLVTLLHDWQTVFNATREPYKIILIDDGSKDKSLQLLHTLQESNPALDVHTQTNAGHGPAILKGYRLALSAEWVFQIDSDHQLDTAAFATLWANRQDFDLLIAERGEKNATAGRNRLSSISRLFVRLLYGRKVRDVNSPYRLMRAEKLREALEKIPDDSFAPNILLTSWFVLKKNRIFTGLVAVRKEGLLRQSKLSGYIFRGALRSAFQTILFRIKS
jgi:dolichol-phosphate mannosyltransferase